MKDLNHYRWQQIDTLFGQALERPPEQRTQFVLEACGTDTELLTHVEKLLHLHDEAEGILGESAGTFAAPLLPELMGQIDDGHPSLDKPGSMIGPYEIIEQIGRGGMGTVYLARKSNDPYEVQAAVKLVRRGMDTQDVLRRFRHEGRILAALKHPNIARLYDGGIHHDGRPWFAMEYIRGEPIDEYCNRHQLSIEERIRLFITVCEAVQHAHQNLVIHRDLKPAHVLVTPGKELKLVDFGIAKLLEPDRMELTNYHTREGIKVMTPEFAAPEQVRGEAVNTASDIYSLGVLLYLLLTGRRPYRTGILSMAEMERLICRTDPVKPSHAVRGGSLPAGSTVDEEPFDAEASAALRKKNVLDLRRMLTGDLDHIVLKALRKEPGERYRSAVGFAEDLENYLNGMPVAARAPTLQYRMQKFMRRNKWIVVAAVAATFSILTGLGIALWQANIATKERDIAQREAAKALAAQDYLVELFEAADPANSQGDQITAREIVQRGIERLEKNLGTEPEVHLEMLKVLGRVELALGDYHSASELLEEALAKTRELRGNHHSDVASVASILGEVVRQQGEFNRAESLLKEALAIFRNFHPADHSDTAITMDRLARTMELKGNFEEAETLYREALVIREKIFGEYSEAFSANLNNIGWLMQQMGRYEDAEEALKQSLAIKKQSIEAPHPSLASNHTNLAVVLRWMGKFEEAEYHSLQALNQRRLLHGDDHPSFTTALSNRSLILIDLARYQEAEENYRFVLQNNRRQLGPEHVYVGFALTHLSNALIQDGRSEEALPLLEEALEVHLNAVGEEHRFYATSLMIQGEALMHQDPMQAVNVLEQSADIFKRVVGWDHPEYAEAMTRLGRVRLLIGEFTSAESTLREALNIQRKTLPDPHLRTIWTLINLGNVLREQNRCEEAEPLLREAVQAPQETLPPGHWRRLAAHLELVACLLNNDEKTSAQHELETVLPALQGRTDFHAIRLQERAGELQNLIPE